MNQGKRFRIGYVANEFEATPRGVDLSEQRRDLEANGLRNLARQCTVQSTAV